MFGNAGLHILINAVSCASEKCPQKLNFTYNFGGIFDLLKIIHVLPQLRLSVLVNGKPAGHPSKKIISLSRVFERYLEEVN